MKKVTNNLEETQKLGEEFGKKARKGEVFLLFGELGAGKTSFVQGLAKGLGVKKRIISPTFVIMRNYPIKKGDFNHLDLYRLSGRSDFEGAGVMDAIKDQNSISAVEWAQKLGDLKGIMGYRLYFNYLSPNQREIRIEENG